MANGSYKSGERVRLKNGKSGVVENSDYDSASGDVVVLVKVSDGSYQSVSVVDLDKINMSASPSGSVKMTKDANGQKLRVGDRVHRPNEPGSDGGGTVEGFFEGHPYREMVQVLWDGNGPIGHRVGSIPARWIVKFSASPYTALQLATAIAQARTNASK